MEEYAAEAPLSHKGTHHVEISKEAATDETQGSLLAIPSGIPSWDLMS
ncbi:hypothetical protein M5E89_09515 [Acidaminococcus intestini]|nr:hypothetical protein M5E89_09515 [Acidaminococcus intestini]